MRREFGADSARRIAAQCKYMAHSRVPVIGHNGIHLLLGGADAGQMSRRPERGVAAYSAHRIQRALAGGAARTIGYRDEMRSDRLELGDGAPERGFRLARFRREKLE